MPKTPSNSHVVEHAVRIGESQRHRRRGKGRLQRAGSSHFARPRRSRRSGSEPARPRRNPEALPPLSLDRGRAGGEGAPPDTTPGAPRDSSCFPCPPKGREEEEEEVPGRETPEEVSARGEVCCSGGTEPEGRGFFLSL